MITLLRSTAIAKREREANRLLVAADPEFARSLGVVVVPSPLPSISAAKAFATLAVSIRGIASEAEEAFAAVGRDLALGPRLPRRGNLSVPPPGIAVPPPSRFG